MTKIEWVKSADGSNGKSWNPMVGCSLASPGCTNCYAMKMAARLEAIGVEHYRGLTQPSKAGAVWTGRVALAPEKVLLEPLKRKKPTTYFVNSMGDLFHEDVPDEWIDKVFAVMALCPQHTFQILTKRAKRMRGYMGDPSLNGRKFAIELARQQLGLSAPLKHAGWPLTNCWLGVSCENQANADERIPDLLATPSAVRFLSCEPLLGPVDLEYPATLFPDGPRGCCSGHECGCMGKAIDPPLLYGLDWVICGSESGPGARPMNEDWVRSLRDQCTAAGTPLFYKQAIVNSRKVSVPELDGRTWAEFPR